MWIATLAAWQIVNAIFWCHLDNPVSLECLFSELEVRFCNPRRPWLPQLSKHHQQHTLQGKAPKTLGKAVSQMLLKLQIGQDRKCQLCIGLRCHVQLLFMKSCNKYLKKFRCWASQSTSGTSMATSIPFSTRKQLQRPKLGTRLALQGLTRPERNPPIAESSSTKWLRSSRFPCWRPGHHLAVTKGRHFRNQKMLEI